LAGLRNPQRRLRSAACHGSGFNQILRCALACSDCFPLSCLCRPQDRIGYILCGEPVAEGWRCRLIRANADEKVGELVDEGVLVANLQSRDPPVLHVRMVAIGDVNALPAAQLSLIAMIEELQPM